MTVLAQLLFGLTIHIAPGQYVLYQGDSAAFQVWVSDEEGRVVQPDEVHVVSLPGSLLEVGNGYIRALGPGAGALVAKAALGDEKAEARVPVKVKAGGLRVDLSSAKEDLKPGEALPLSAVVRDAVGGLIDADLNWKVVPHWLGEVSTDGTFRAYSTPGTGRVVVIAKSKGLKGMASSKIAVTGGEPRLYLSLSPSESRLKVGEHAKFELSAEGVSRVEAVDYRVDPPGLGEIDVSGNFVAKSVGRGLVTVTVRAPEGVGSAKSFVAVGEPAKPKGNPLKSLRLSSNLLFIKPGETVKVVCAAEGLSASEKSAIMRDGRFSWSWSKGPFIKAAGTTQSAEVQLVGLIPGFGRVYLKVQHGGKSRSFELPFVVGEHRIAVSPHSVSLSPGEEVRFEVKNAKVRDIVRWQVYPGKAGILEPETGRFIAAKGYTGKAYVVALLPGGIGGGGAVAEVFIREK